MFATPSLKRKTPAVLLAIIVLQILIHLPVLQLPPSGQHTWRQVVGYAAARSYHAEDASFWYPRADIRFHATDKGEAYHEFPLVYWLVGKSYDLFGENPYTARLIPLLVNLCLLVAAYALGRALEYSEQRSLWYAFLISAAPIYLYYSAALTPDLMGLTIFTSAVALIIPPIRAGQINARLLAGLLLVGLATLSKPTYLFFGLPIAYIFLTLPPAGRRLRMLALAGAAGALIGAANLGVIQHARQLHQNAHPERAIHTPVGPAEAPTSVAVVVENLHDAVLKWFMEMFVNLGALPLFLAGLWLAWRSRAYQTWAGRFWMSWLLSLGIYCCFFIVRLSDHDYYITSALPLAAVLSSLGASVLLQKRWQQALAVSLILVVGFFRVQGRWFDRPEVPQQLLREGSSLVDDVIPPNDLILVSGDKSPIVFLYYLERKGFSLDARSRDLSELDIAAFPWLVDYRPAGRLTPDVKERFGLTEVATRGDFTIYQTKAHPSRS